MPGNKHEVNEVDILLSQATSGLCGHSFIFSLLVPYADSPLLLFLGMDSDGLAKHLQILVLQSASAFCTSACFQLPTLFANCIHPTSACVV